METTPVATGTATAPKPATTARNGITSDFETFLRLLTAQIQNQDPLNPTPSDEFAVQLATFSSVEQQVRTNELLTALGGSLGDGLARVAGWVGMEGRAAASVSFDGSPVTLWPRPAAGSDRAELVVRDATGREVQRIDVPVSSDPFAWDGLAEGGRSLPRGSYSFELVSFSAGMPVESSAVEAFGRIVEVRSENGEAMAVFESGAVIPAASVTGLRTSGGG